MKKHAFTQVQGRNGFVLFLLRKGFLISHREVGNGTIKLPAPRSDLTAGVRTASCVMLPWKIQVMYESDSSVKTAAKLLRVSYRPFL